MFLNAREKLEFLMLDILDTFDLESLKSRILDYQDIKGSKSRKSNFKLQKF